MKICATCQRKYADSLQFCLEDGTVLSSVNVPPPTVKFENPSNRPNNSMKRYLPFIIILVVLAAAVGILAMLLKGGGGGGGEASNTTFALTNSPAQPSNTGTNTPPAASAPGLTKPNVKVSSPVVLEEYGDYQCPPCGQLYPELKKIEAEYGDQLRVVFHHFPLAKMHKNALAAARAAEAARNQNKFWEMHDRLYLNQKAWAELDDPLPIFTSYARELKLNVEQFIRDMQSSEVEQRIEADVQKGTALGVTGTPTVFIDTHMLKYEATNPEGLRRGINIMLEKKAAS
jgi:protein-disulfide isomerase